MDIEIRKLSPELAEDYVCFFDATPHSERPDNFKCYCVMWCSDNHHILNRKFLASEKVRRSTAVKYIQNDILQGYLAYCGGKVVGWCNANTKSDCVKCFSWRMGMKSVPAQEAGVRVKSVFCFAVAPEMRRQGISKLLLERVCLDAARDGFDYVEAYPCKMFANEADDFMGPAELFRQSGFVACGEADNKLVMRKKCKETT